MSLFHKQIGTLERLQGFKMSGVFCLSVVVWLMGNALAQDYKVMTIYLGKRWQCCVTFPLA